MGSKLFYRIGTAALLSMSLAAGGPAFGEAKNDYTSMSAEELADHLIFEQKGFDLDQKTQEGGTVRDRLEQDEIQKACSALKGGSIDDATATKVTKIAKDNMKYPEGGIELGDWKKGEALVLSGFGFRVGHNTDDHADSEPGGNCQACHQLDPADINYGTLGPSLTGYGKTRGTSEEMRKYTYGIIYNAHATFPCTNMPRFGANGFLTEEQILDIMAYLMDPDSPVNKSE